MTFFDCTANLFYITFMFRPGIERAKRQFCHFRGREAEPVDTGVRFPGCSGEFCQAVPALQDCI